LTRAIPAWFGASMSDVTSQCPATDPSGPAAAGSSGAGARVPPGLYFLMMDHMGTRQTRRLVLLR